MCVCICRPLYIGILVLLYSSLFLSHSSSILLQVIMLMSMYVCVGADADVGIYVYVDRCRTCAAASGARHAPTLHGSAATPPDQ